MISIKTRDEINRLRVGGKHLAKMMQELKKKAVLGVAGDELENLARSLVTKVGDQPAFLNYKQSNSDKPYPAALCLSINDEIVHGLPNQGNKILKEGDIVSLDMGLVHDSMYTDMAVTVPIGKITKEAEQLIKVAEAALYAGINKVREGASTGDIGYAIEQLASSYGFGIIRELAGHGVGYGVHEEPFIPNYGLPGEGPIFKEGMVIAIEPMLTLGDRNIILARDGFTYKTRDGSISAHFEHTVLVKKKGFEILTSL